jgi:ribosomal-protein-alanine N-acetyltransferase
VAEQAGDVVAYGVVAMGAGEAHILNVCVASGMRGRGIGRRMMQLLLERSAQAGMHDVFLEVRPSNPHAIALYQSLGFNEVGRRRGYYQADGGREDALVLKLSLPVKSGG